MRSCQSTMVVPKVSRSAIFTIGLVEVHDEVDAAETDVGLRPGGDDPRPPVARVLPARGRALHDFALVLDPRRPEARPIDARPEAVLGERRALALLPQPEIHPERLRLEDDAVRGSFAIGIEMLVDAVRVDDDRVTAFPVVAHAVVDLVAATVEDVVERLGLVTVSLVLAARSEVDGVHLEALREERIVPGSDEPLSGRACAHCRVAGRGVLAVREDETGPGLADARGLALALAMLGEPVRLGADPAEEDALPGHGANLDWSDLLVQRAVLPRRVAPPRGGASSSALDHG